MIDTRPQALQFSQIAITASEHSVTLKSLEQYNKEPIMSVKLLVHWTLELRNILRGSRELFMNIASSHSVECRLNGFQKNKYCHRKRYI